MHKENGEILVLPVCLVHQEELVILDRPGHLARVVEEILDRQAEKDRPEKKDRPVRKEILVHPVVLLVLPARKEIKGHLDLLDHPEKMEQLARKGLKAHLASKEFLVAKELQVHLVAKELKVHRVTVCLVLQVFKVYLDRSVRKDHLDLALSSLVILSGSIKLLFLYLQFLWLQVVR